MHKSSVKKTTGSDKDMNNVLHLHNSENEISWDEEKAEEEDLAPDTELTTPVKDDDDQSSKNNTTIEMSCLTGL